MKIDCHCHVFNNDCIPVKGLLHSRFGVVVGNRLFKRINPYGDNGAAVRPDELHLHFSMDVDSLSGSLTDPAEKDSIRYLATHPLDFIRFTLAGMKSMPAITAAMMEKAPDIDIWVPLMMDTRNGYAGDASRTGFDEQKWMMMALTAMEKGRIMPFFAYDPRSGSVDAVKTAIERDGFVGVKLYPPLGFKPCGNDDHEVEANLEDLYAYCAAGRPSPIPITAHCSWSDGVYSNREAPGVSCCKDYYRDLAHPAHWAKVLEKHGNLKLNLAHFGGAGEWERRALSPSAAAMDRNWAAPIIRLMRDYEHVYTDLSFHGNLAGRNGDAYAQALREAIRGLEDRVLLGSDWYMSAIQCDLDDYWRNFKTAFPDLFDAMTGPNAVRFLQSPATLTFFPAFLASREGMASKFVNLFQQTA
jgi:predicted TIM-barrel fold metal-dependent hydrolase